jgi:hypothetical protein
MRCPLSYWHDRAINRRQGNSIRTLLAMQRLFSTFSRPLAPKLGNCTLSLKECGKDYQARMRRKKSRFPRLAFTGKETPTEYKRTLASHRLFTESTPSIYAAAQCLLPRISSCHQPFMSPDPTFPPKFPQVPVAPTCTPNMRIAIDETSVPLCSNSFPRHPRNYTRAPIRSPARDCRRRRRWQQARDPETAPAENVSLNPALAFGISATISVIISGTPATNGSSTRLRRSSVKTHVPCLKNGAIARRVFIEFSCTWEVMDKIAASSTDNRSAFIVSGQ